MKKVCLFPMGVYMLQPGSKQHYSYTAQETIKMLGLYSVYREQREHLTPALNLERLSIGLKTVELWAGTQHQEGDPLRPFPLGALAIWQVEHKEPLFFRELQRLPILPGLRVDAVVSSWCPTPAMVALFFLGEVERPEEVEQ